MKSNFFYLIAQFTILNTKNKVFKNSKHSVRITTWCNRRSNVSVGCACGAMAITTPYNDAFAFSPHTGTTLFVTLHWLDFFFLCLSCVVPKVFNFFKILTSRGNYCKLITELNQVLFFV